MNILILCLIVGLVGFMFIAPTIEMVQAVNTSENPATAPRKIHPKHNPWAKKVCGLQLC